MVPRKQAAHASQGCAANALRHQLELFQAVPLPVDAACQGALVRLQGGEACWRWVRGMQGAGQAGMRATCAQACSHLQLVFSTAAYLPRRAQQARCIASCHVRQARLHSALRGEQGRQGCWGAASELYRTIIYTYTCIYTYTHIYITCVCVCMRLAHWFLQVSFPCSSRHAKCSTAQGRMDAHLASLVEARSVQVQWRRLHTWRCAGKLVGRALGVARAAGRRLGQQPHWPDLFECARPPPRYACAGTTRPRRVATVLHASPLHALPLFNSGSPPPPPPPPLLSRSQPCRALCFFSKYKQV